MTAGYFDLPLDRVSIQLRHPGATSWATVANDHRRHDVFPIDDVTITWTRPTPRDHSEPGSISFTILMPAPQASTVLAYDTEARILVYLDGWPDGLLVAHGWVTQWTRSSRKVRGLYSYLVRAVDPLGRAASTMIGDDPWPSENNTTRLARLNTISPAGPLVTPPSSSRYVAARDVDNTSALDLIKRCCPPGVTVHNGPADRVVLQADPNLGPGNQFAIPIPARCIEETGRQLDRASTITEIAIEAVWQGPSAPVETITIKGQTEFRSTSRWNLHTDAFVGDEERVTDWAEALIEFTTETAVRIPTPPRIALVRAGLLPFQIGAFLEQNRRTRTLIAIEAAPADIEPVHWVTGGTITLHGTHATVAVQLEPGNLSGVRAVRINDLPRIHPDALDFTTFAALHPTRTIGDYDAVSFIPQL